MKKSYQPLPNEVVVAQRRKMDAAGVPPKREL